MNAAEPFFKMLNCPRLSLSRTALSEQICNWKRNLPPAVMSLTDPFQVCITHPMNPQLPVLAAGPRPLRYGPSFGGDMISGARVKTGSSQQFTILRPSTGFVECCT